MGKTKKVYSTSDFASATSSILVESSFWAVDSVDFTKAGEFSNTPLFEVELKKIVVKSKEPIPGLPEGWTDASAEMEPNRTYYVRDGRPMYNELLKIWYATDGDKEEFVDCAMHYFANKGYRGRVERLNGVSYSLTTKRGTIVQKSAMELWYPDALNEGRVLDDFVFLCNKGVYTPTVEEKKEELIDLTKVDPKIIAAIKAMMK